MMPGIKTDHPPLKSESVRTGIALGSNLGDRVAHLRRAVDELRAIHTQGRPFLISPVYQTEPRFCPPDSPPFLNAVVEIAWTGTAEDLLRHTLRIESALGRRHGGPRNAPREIDIDILYLGDQLVRTPSLELPHPRLLERRFVLHPLSDIRPDLILPGRPHPIAEELRLLVTDEPSPAVLPEPLILT